MAQQITEFLRQTWDAVSVWLVWGFNGYYVMVSALLANLWAVIVLGAGAVVIRAAREG